MYTFDLNLTWHRLGRGFPFISSVVALQIRHPHMMLHPHEDLVGQQHFKNAAFEEDYTDHLSHYRKIKKISKKCRMN